MSITDELREWAVNHRAELDMGQLYPAMIECIADRIDAEHEAKVSYWQGASYKDGYDEGFASADDWLAQHESDMAEHGWIRLPKDADGEYIHIGDVMDSKVDHLFDGRPFEVRALVLCEDGWEAADGRFGNRYEPNSLRHHHAPTVEDVLREFTDAILEWSGKSGTVAEVGTWSDVAAEYAKRLTLVKGEDA